MPIPVSWRVRRRPRSAFPAPCLRGSRATGSDSNGCRGDPRKVIIIQRGLDSDPAAALLPPRPGRALYHPYFLPGQGFGGATAAPGRQRGGNMSLPKVVIVGRPNVGKSSIL